MRVRPYGDTLDDGAVQLSFTMPLADSPRTREAARKLVLKLGFESCEIVHSASMADGFTMFVAYARTSIGVDPETEVELDPGVPRLQMDFYQINEFIKNKIGRKIVVVGATTGYDAHTVGIDAIMNMKGINQHYGLERYPMIDAHNLGAQVPNEELIEYAVEHNADAILISQAVTQKDSHRNNLSKFVEILKQRGLREKFIIIAGGPRISHQLATELGFDAGFDKGTYPEHVAAFIMDRLANRLEE